MSKNSFIKKAMFISAMLVSGLALSVAHSVKASAATLYSLQSRANYNYVCADNYGNNPLVANRTSASAWEQYQVINNSDGTISFQSMANYKYVCADLNQGANLIARSTSIQQWEKFKKVNLADGTIALQAMANNQFVSTDLNNGGVLVANKGAVGGAWEAYSLIATGSTSSVSKPSEVPSNIWGYAMNADNRFGKNGDFALLICAMIKQESSFGAGLTGVSAGDGLMQVEPNTRNAYSSEFQSTYGHYYDNNNAQDQVYMGSMIVNDMINLAGGNIYKGLEYYNGGQNWYPGATDSYGRPILADQYANTVYGTYKSYGGLH
ncbi:hypothetical protein CSC2_45460 [Clostridium zeae]|uniref:Transglycosylase SLT domain-containing protein n=1 Tax=Clostridium zeae TaxID=2759022 RepID=A0ABQ1EHB6_9CLOT|nr:lytic transglycosylase domain-containing protein [Clostridium zeae]GFZ34020.1 hypothetical protein CSC2_45460 [Clostridium zeae]